ncbi:MAG: type II toxin-antitoxin system VapC family toxin [Actinomycetota bacterium]
MNVYFETSALVKLFLDESGADTSRDLWDEADFATVARIAYPEARAAFASAHRAGRITGPELEDAKGRLNQLWTQVQIVELDAPVAISAGELAETFALSGFDAVHLVTAIEVQDESLVVATWDADLRVAALDASLQVAPVL